MARPRRGHRSTCGGCRDSSTPPQPPPIPPTGACSSLPPPAPPTGELAAGWTDAWLLTPREHLVRHLLDVYPYLADLEPDDRTALHLLQQALRLAPTNEHVHRRVLQRHAAGDHDGLRRAAASLTEHLTAHNLPHEPATVALLTTLLTDPADPPPGAPTCPGHTERKPG